MSPPGRVPAPPHGSPADECRHAGTPANMHCIGRTLPDSIAGSGSLLRVFQKQPFLPASCHLHIPQIRKPAVHLPAVNSFFSESFLHNAKMRSVLLVFPLSRLPVFSILLSHRFSGILSFLLQLLSGSVLRLPVLFSRMFFLPLLSKDLWPFLPAGSR